MAEARTRARRRTPAGTAELDFADPHRVAGTVERVTFHSEDTGFCVLRVNAARRREPVTVVGTAASVGPGEFVEAQGAWVNDRNYGLQFRAEHLRVVPPSTLEGIEKYLGSGMIRGIGPHFAARLVRAFGAEVFEVIENEPARLVELPGIGPKRQAQVVAAWAEQRAVREIMVFLQSHGVGSARAVRIYRLYGDAAVERVRENPYRLALDVRGIGFRTADGIARSIGFDPDSLPRARAGLRHVLQETAADGHSAAERGELLAGATELLEVDREVAARALAREVEEGELVEEERGGESWIYLPVLHRSERGAASHLGRLLADARPPWGVIDPAKAIPWVEQRVGFDLSGSQREAVARAIRERVTVITGGPGVGKTTIVNAVLGIVRAKRVRARLCAPTGRAAKRLAESTGLEASTIHRLLEFDPATGGFKHGPDQPLDTDFVVVDEVSMVDVVLANQLFRAVPEHAALLLVGDVDQLPSVGPGAVLAEIIESGRAPTVRLTEIFRQAESSRIVVNAHRINRGETPEYPRPAGRSAGSGPGPGPSSGPGRSPEPGPGAGAASADADRGHPPRRSPGDGRGDPASGPAPVAEPGSGPAPSPDPGAGADPGGGGGPRDPASLSASGAGVGRANGQSGGHGALSDFYVIPVRDPEEARERLVQVVTDRIPRRFGLDPTSDLQVLTPGRRGGLGAAALNAELQARLNPDAPAAVTRFGTTFAGGDKVLQTVNDYQKEVFNGDIGRIASVDLEEQTVTVDFEGRPVPYEFNELDELSLAYAITVHKSQGSEFPAVVIPLTTQHYMLLQRNLLYTGVTRGKRLVVLVAEPRALAIAVKRYESVQRRSRLAERLRSATPWAAEG